MTGNGEIKSYRDLLIWQKGMALAKQVYAMTRAFPGEERFGLTAQMRRAVVLATSH
jgi:four helix bundle protein